MPTHNRKEFIKQCLQCVEKQKYPDIETVVIDDGSIDGTINMIRHQFSQTTVLRGNGSLWWGGSMRAAVKYVMHEANEKDFVLLMNDDTVFDPTYVQKIISVSNKNKRAIVGSVCFDVNNKKKVIEAGVKINWERNRIDYPLKLPRDIKRVKTKEVDTMCGRGALVPIEVFSKIGRYSTRLPHYLSDYEFFIRAKKAGFKLLISYEAVTYSTTKPGGIKFELKKKTLKRWWEELFSRKSRSNIIDKINFAILVTPKQHRYNNLTRILRSFLFRLSFVSPIYYIREPLIKIIYYPSGLLWCIKRRLKGLPC